jgi:hypothetical protein
MLLLAGHLDFHRLYPLTNNHAVSLLLSILRETTPPLVQTPPVPSLLPSSTAPAPQEHSALLLLQLSVQEVSPLVVNRLPHKRLQLDHLKAQDEVRWERCRAGCQGWEAEGRERLGDWMVVVEG